MQNAQKGKVSYLIEIGLIGIALLVITILHFRWLHAPYFYNMVLQFLYYLPVIYSAVRFGIRGGIIVALAASTAYAVHYPIGRGKFPRNIDAYQRNRHT
jgi:integral membrane sensor domain MASE1